MKTLVRASGGLIGRVFAILLLAILIEYGINTFVYERASQFSVREDEAHRLAEYLVIARKLVSEAPVARREAMAAELTTDRYALTWRRALPPPAALAPSLDTMHRQITAWEPGLASSDLRLRLTSPGRHAFIIGGLQLPDRSWLYFRTLEPLNQLDFAVSRILFALTPAAALILIGGLAVRHTLRPMRKLVEAAARVGHGEVEPVPEHGPAEVRKVIAAFNTMQGRIHSLIRDRTQALAAVSHDLRTPLARLRLRADAIGDDEVRDAVQDDLIEMDAMVGSLLAYLGGDGDDERPQAIDLAVLCGTLVDGATDRGMTASYEGPDHHDAVVRPIGLKRALSNLVENAVQHGGSAHISLAPSAESIVIDIDDNGPGIPQDKLDKVLEPFVRLDAARQRDTVGFGLGLPIVARAIAAEGGTLTLENRAEGGLRARIVLPRQG